MFMSVEELLGPLLYDGQHRLYVRAVHFFVFLEPGFNIGLLFGEALDAVVLVGIQKAAFKIKVGRFVQKVGLSLRFVEGENAAVAFYGRYHLHGRCLAFHPVGGHDAVPDEGDVAVDGYENVV